MSRPLNRKYLMLALLPILVCLAIYCLCLAVMYRHLPEQLPKSMAHGEVTEWVSKSLLWVFLLVDVVLMALFVGIEILTHRLGRRKDKQTKVSVLPQVDRKFAKMAFVATVLICLVGLFNGLKSIFYNHFSLLETIAGFLIVAFILVCVGITVAIIALAAKGKTILKQ